MSFTREATSVQTVSLVSLEMGESFSRSIVSFGSASIGAGRGWLLGGGGASTVGLDAGGRRSNSSNISSRLSWQLAYP
jgi:hypothetical protein